MPEEPTGGATGRPTGRPTGREAEVLAARRESLERLGPRRAFAITLADVLDVAEPTRSSAVRAEHPDLAADTQTDDVVTVAGRVVLKRDMGKLVFATLRDRDALRRRGFLAGAPLSGRLPAGLSWNRDSRPEDHGLFETIQRSAGSLSPQA